MVRALVTGGAGFVGSNIVDALEARGDLVVALDDLSTGDRNNLAPDIAFRHASIADEKKLFDAVHGEGFDVIVHCASKTKVVESMEKEPLYRKVIVDGTRNVLALAEHVNARFFVNLSTGGAMYGETPRCATEATPAVPDSNYGKFKLEAERLVEESEIPSITLRLANVYGPRQRTDLEGGVVAIFMKRWQERKPLTVFGDGSGERDYVFVGDIADAVTSSFTGDWTGLYNIGTGVATSVTTLIKEMTRILGPAPKIEHAPPRPIEIRRSCLDARRAERDGLWKPKTDLAKGLKQTLALG